MLRALAVGFAVIAVGCLVAAVIGIITGRPGPRLGGVLRLIAVLCFITTVVLNTAAH